MGEYVDFKAVKAEASVEAVAVRYGVDLRRVNSSHDRGRCPLPTHPAGDDAKSFSINVTKQVWICHSTACAKARRGKKGGDVIELVAVMDGCSLRDAGLKLASWFGIISEPNGSNHNRAGENHSLQPAGSERATDSDSERCGRYGEYDVLAKWIEKRSASDLLSRSERAAYMSVLGQIEELAKTGGGD